MKRIASQWGMRTAAIASLAAVWVAAAPAAFADEVIVVRNTMEIPDGMMGSNASVGTVGSAWWMPGSVFSAPESGRIHSIAAILYGGSTQFGPWSEDDWQTLGGFRIHVWMSESDYFGSPNLGEHVVTLSHPSNTDWLISTGENHIGWPTFRFVFDISHAAIEIVEGQIYVIAFQAISTPVSSTGFVYHSLSDGGYGQHLDLFASYSMNPAYLWQHGAPHHYHATAVTVQVPRPKCAPADLNCDSVVDVSDLLILLAAWGTCGDSCDCPADLNGNGAVDVSDLLQLLANWG